MRYTSKGNIREYIMEMSHFTSKLRALKLKLSENLLVHLVLISLPTKFNQFKVSYNFQKESWSLYELASHYAQEEDRLKKNKAESAHIASTSKGKYKDKKRKKNKEATNTSLKKKQQKKSGDQKGIGKFFYRVNRHKKKYVLTLVPRYTW